VIGRYPSEVVQVVCAGLAPFAMLFGFYVIAHGHYGPGGGFAGGVVLAVGVILMRLTVDRDISERVFSAGAGTVTACLGLLLFVAVGLVSVFGGGMFLDYAQVAVADLEPSRLRYLGILLVEVAIGFAVAGTMVLLFDTIAEGDDR